MKNYVRELCKKKGIKPVFTENKFTILSTGTLNGIPILRIHKIFATCTRETAEAVVNYYFDLENRGNDSKLIQDHASQSLQSGDYRIAPLSDNFMTAFIVRNNVRKGNIDFESILAERTISSITQKSYNGSNSTEILGETIKVQDDSITELDIVIDL